MLTALLVLAAMTPIPGSLDLLTRNRSLAEWIDRKNEESCRQTRNTLVHLGWLQTPEEAWIYEGIPQTDFSKGGVYFFGSSLVQFSTKLWELPPDLQALIHNCGMPACNQKSELVWLRYLIEQTAILKAGGDKTLVVLGTSYHNAFYPRESIPAPFANALERHGLFACDSHQGIRPLPVNAISKFMDFEETRQAACMTRFRDLFLHQLTRWRHHGTEPPRRQDPALYADWRRQQMGPDWKKEIDETIPVFRQTIDYLRARHVQVRVVLMPCGSWEKGLPYDSEYRRQVTALCAEDQIPVSDWSGLLSNEDFADSTHPNIFGTEKTHAAFLDIALPFLRSTHALSADRRAY